MVVTNRCFTRRAITLAKVNNAELWDRNRLAREILAIRAPTLPAPTDRTLEAEPPEVASVGFCCSPIPASHLPDLRCCYGAATFGLRRILRMLGIPRLPRSASGIAFRRIGACRSASRLP